jgi:predicted adenylyl cyclase CyaB
MVNETELKLRLGSEAQMNRVLAWCEEHLGKGSRLEQRDEYYDTAGEDLRNHDLSLRLRTVNGKMLVAMKSPRVFLTNNIHERIELEFAAADRNDVLQTIKRYGLKPTAITEKLRWKFEKDDFTVIVDQLPFIGCFAEIEAPNVERINAVVAILGLSPFDGVNKNYSELLEEKLTELGLPLRPNLRATFCEEEKWKSKASS